ncbi:MULTISPECIES: elongation factor G [unclassified Breznakia]|uniref:elongation factor G n=1 Tax=unclassified Breznakia TaxID=2623764 RepID=UPI00247599CA|nr:MULTISPECIES: elongation factor G [unclassified Breznakia]MDH6367169.1 elongation factor G [Breznakia sp. PH1-1]MDH6404411.1 elongation factor G [Breznakia sp. PF1-11]MDH6412120.1 elongation factor G [Breznakia sp. PFB1-11]MDH6414399.1 elongation factor G [Breznakia sp. PFB1-14]MDH6416671.1 elongation factor G [Breznakia sp. PFB1-4]
MRDYKSSEIRNVAVLGHSGSGKTSILEAMLYFTKASDRFGKTSEGSSLIDYDSEEIARGMSIYTSIVPIEWQDYKINFLDTPGYLDYIGEQEAAMEVCDNALIIVSAKDKVQPGTINAWEAAKDKKIPAIFFINKLDEDHTSFDETYNALRDTFGKSVIPFEMPILENGEVIGSINILRDKVWYFKGDKASRDTAYDVPDDYRETVDTYKAQIAETVAMGDDELMEKYFSGEEFTEAQLTKGVRIGVRNGDIVPVFSGSATLSVGIERLMDLIVKYFPTYGEQGTIVLTDTKTNELIELQTAEDETLSALVFKTIVDPFVGKISFLKVLSGTLTSDTAVYNPKKDEMEKISQIFIIKGKHQTAVGKLFTGDIGAVSKLQFTQTNDTLCDKGKHYVADPIPFTKGLLGHAIRPKTKADDDKVNGALQKVLEEDQTTWIDNNKETKQIVLYGVGEQHFEVIVNKMKNRYKVDVELSDPKVQYRETIKKKVEAEGRHKKQSGGHGQFGHVFIEFLPNPDEEEMVFETRVVGGAVPKGYFPAVETGLREAMETGVLAGYKMVNTKAVLYDGKYHDVDSNELSFKLAASLAYKDGIPKANPVLLEPIMSLRISVPDEYTGNVIGEINKRRGMIISMDLEGGKQVITATAPLAEILDFPTILRACTQGRGHYTQEFERYDEIPNAMKDQIIDKARKAKEA